MNTCVSRIKRYLNKTIVLKYITVQQGCSVVIRLMIFTNSLVQDVLNHAQVKHGSYKKQTQIYINIGLYMKYI